MHQNPCPWFVLPCYDERQFQQVARSLFADPNVLYLQIVINEETVVEGV